MCHRHTPSLKRNLSTKIFAKSAAACFLLLTKDFNTFYPGPANLVGLFSGSSRPRPACACQFPPASCRLCLLFPSYPSLPAPAPAACACAPLVCRSMVTRLPLPAPVSPRQSLFATARCRYPHHHAKRIVPSHHVRACAVDHVSPSRPAPRLFLFVSPRSRASPRMRLHAPSCASQPRRHLPAPPCAPGPFLRTRASENYRGE